MVSVYSVGDFSIEICGGPHVKNTSELGKFKIINQDQIKGKKILLIDDIRTSGISILECADILLKEGAKEVISLSLGTNTSNEPPKERA